jgi:hypothetical protein
VFLCRLIEKLEMIEIPGINPKPKTMAGCIVNIRKVFNILKKKPGFSVKLLYDEESVYNCETEFLLELLDGIKSVYRASAKVHAADRLFFFFFQLMLSF